MSDGIPLHPRIRTRCGMCGEAWGEGHTCIWPIFEPTKSTAPGLTAIEEDLTRRIEVLERIVATLLAPAVAAAPATI